MADDTERDDSAYQRMRAIIDEVGGEFGCSIAEWGRRCAERCLELGDVEVMVLSMSGGFDREISRGYSQAKASARNARAAATSGSAVAERATQLSFPIIVPGLPPMPLVRATHRLIIEALKAEKAQLKGRVRNIAALRQFASITESHPDRTVGDLLSAGVISLADLETAA